jgi:nicotinamidase-related amidase
MELAARYSVHELARAPRPDRKMRVVAAPIAPGAARWEWEPVSLMTEPFTFDPGDALLVVDVINDFEHEDGDRLLASFRERLAAMTKAIAAARTAGVPVVYVNDERGRWDSNAPALVQAVLDSEHGSEVASELVPESGDHFLLKHRYSAFDHTALDLLMEDLRVARIVLIGAATEGCIVQTAIDARECGLKATILIDACATTDHELEATALKYAEQVVGARIARDS